jgi:MFS family permease
MWNRSTTSLMLGSALASFGAWIDFLAIMSLAAYVHQVNAWGMALVSALMLVPSMAIGARVGRWIDQHNPRTILVASLVLRTALTALLWWASSLVVLCVLVAARAVATVALEPASNALVARRVPHEWVPRYFGALGVWRNASKIAAPALGAVLASRWGEGAAIGASVAMTLLAAAAILCTGPNAVVAAPTTDHPTGNVGAIPSADHEINTPLLQQLLWTATLYAFMVFLLNHQLAVLLRNAGFDKALLGVLMSCSGAGGIVAAAWLTRRGPPTSANAHPMRATTWSVLATALCFIAIGLAFMLPAQLAPLAICGLFFCTGVFASVEAIRANTVVVQAFPAAVGEVTGRLQSLQSSAMLIAPWLAALAIPHVSASMLFIGDGATAFVAVLLVAVFFQRRRVTSPQAPPPSSRSRGGL